MENRSGLQLLLDSYGATETSEDSQDSVKDFLTKKVDIRVNPAPPMRENRRQRKQGKPQIRRVQRSDRVPSVPLRDCVVNMVDCMDRKNAHQLQEQYGVRISSMNLPQSTSEDDSGKANAFEITLDKDDTPMPDGVLHCMPPTGITQRLIRQARKVELLTTVDPRFMDYSLTSMTDEGQWRLVAGGHDFVRLKESNLTATEAAAVPFESHQARPNLRVPWGQMPVGNRFPNRPTKDAEMPDTSDCDPEEGRCQRHNAANRTFYFNEKVRKRYLQLGVQAYRAAFLDLFTRITQFEHTGQLEIPAFYKFPIYADAEALVEDEEEEMARHRLQPARSSHSATTVLRRSSRHQNS